MSPPFASAASAQREFLAAAARRQQPDAGFDEPDIAFERGDRAVAVHDELAAAAEREPVDRGDGRHQRILQRCVVS